MNLKGKKILVLGANAETIPIVLKAQKMGVYVIVTDYIINSPAKLIADEYDDIDGKDIELIVDVIKKREVGGETYVLVWLNLFDENIYQTES